MLFASNHSRMPIVMIQTHILNQYFVASFRSTQTDLVDGVASSKCLIQPSLFLVFLGIVSDVSDFIFVIFAVRLCPRRQIPLIVLDIDLCLLHISSLAEGFSHSLSERVIVISRPDARHRRVKLIRPRYSITMTSRMESSGFVCQVECCPFELDSA